MPALSSLQIQGHFWKNGGIECICMRVGEDDGTN